MTGFTDCAMEHNFLASVSGATDGMAIVNGDGIHMGIEGDARDSSTRFVGCSISQNQLSAVANGGGRQRSRS